MHSYIRLILSLSFLATTKSRSVKPDTPNLLLVSFDGFRWNYLNRTDTPNFDIFLKKGVHTKFGLKNAFITKTFPNHYTLATGLWEESHGIVANTMYDPNLKEVFTLANRGDQRSAKWFDNGGEPIWVTSQLQGSNHRTGIVMYPGGCAPVKNVLATECLLFDPSVDNKTRVDKIIEWFTMENPINLGLLYFEQPDQFGHAFGPESEQVTRMIGGLDEVVGYLLKKLEENDLLEKTNVIITSDHGFASSPPDKVINLDNYIDPLSYQIFTHNPIGNILPNRPKGRLEELYMNLTKASAKEGHFKVYMKEDIPDRYHYKHNDRIMPILIVAEDHYQLKYNGSGTEAGTHGWDNKLLDMHPFFVAMGPTFKAGSSAELLDNVDVYPLMCYLLGIKPAPNNGSVEPVLPLLKTPSEMLSDQQDQNDSSTAATFATYIGILVLIASVGGVFIVAACRQHRYLKRQKRKILLTPSLLGGLRYTTPPNGAKVPLLSETDDDDDILDDK